MAGYGPERRARGTVPGRDPLRVPVGVGPDGRRRRI